jgi:translocation protein SEC62
MTAQLTIQAPAELKAVADFLRSKNGPKVRRGVLNGKRVDYFKGESRRMAVTALRLLRWSCVLWERC